jgi:hypothetical protein
MPELSGRELVQEWRRLMDAMLDAVTAITGRQEVPAQIVEPLQRQLELVQELIERERRLQAEVATRLLAPTDIAFELLERSGTTMRRQAEALEAAGDALRETASLMTSQAELFEQAIGKLRAPADVARSTLGVQPRSRRKSAARPRGRPKKPRSEQKPKR